MKKIFVIFLVTLSIACRGNKVAVQDIQQLPVKETKDREQQEDRPKIKIPIEEKAPDFPIDDIVKPQKKGKIQEPILQKKELKSKKVTTPNHQQWSVLLSKHVSDQGKVDYKGFIKDKKALKAYLDILSTYAPNDNWSQEDKLAYWINVYNAFTIKLIIDNYPIKSIKDLKNPWDLRFFELGKKSYTLNEVEHKILRKMKEPRIHFGINCASKSCPPLYNKAFTSKNVDDKLNELTTRFINNSNYNTINKDRIELSKIFSWFEKDFKTQGTLIDFLNTYARVKIDTKAKKNFKKYNWGLNE